MPLKIGYRLEPEQIQTTITYINKNSEKGLVKKVLEEETTFMKECKRMAACNEKEFYHIREELVEILNQYDFDGMISEDKKRLLDYKIFHEEFKKLKKQKKKWKTITWSGSFSGGAIAFLSIFLLGGPIAALITVYALAGSAIAGICGADKISELDKTPLKEFIAMRTYYDLVSKSKEADKFMADYQFLKENYIPLIESSDKNKNKGVSKK